MLNSELESMNAMETMASATPEEPTVTQEPATAAPSLVSGETMEDERLVKALERYPDVRNALTKEQLAAREERRTELQDTFSYDDYKGVRMEMHASLHDPSVMIRERSISFNQPCINSLEGVLYVQIYFSETLGRMAIKPVPKNTPHAMHWCAEGKGERKSRKVTCPDMTKLFWDTMGWQKGIRYKVLGYLIEVDGEPIYVFDFKYAKMYNESRRDENGNRVPADRKGHYPKELARAMMMPMDEFEKSMTVEKAEGIISSDMLVSEDNQPAATEPAQEGQKAATEAVKAEEATVTAPETEEAVSAPVAPRVGDGYLGQTGMAASPAFSNTYML